MGSRGRGALLTKVDREAAQQSTRELPWKREGLTRAQRVIAFLEFLPVTKGILAGNPMELLPDQREFVEAIYGRQQDDGRREVTLAIKSAPKGNGKTGLSAGLALCHLLGPEAEVRGEVYSASIDKDHAGKLFREMEAIILKIPEFACRVNIQRFKKTIEVLEGDGEGSVSEALSADAKKAQGLAPSFWVYDELAQVDDREMLDNLLEGMGKRKEALGLIISTQARSDDHALSTLIDEGLKGEDPSTLVHLICVPPEANIFDDDVLRRANPAWGKYLDLKDLMRSKDRARRMPSFEPAFRNLRCNQRIEAKGKAWITRPVWQACEENLVDFENGRAIATWFRFAECYMGLDLSFSFDLSALSFLFPEIITNAQGHELYGPDGRPLVRLVGWIEYFTPADTAAEREERDRLPYPLWIKQGLIHACPGKVIRVDHIGTRIAQALDTFDVRWIAFDRYRHKELDTQMDDLGIHAPWIEHPQGFRRGGQLPFPQFRGEDGKAIDNPLWMPQSVDQLEARVIEKTIRIQPSPVTRSHVSAVVIRPDPAGTGNRVFDKRKAVGRIDGIVSLAMAVGAAEMKLPKQSLAGFLNRPVMTK